MPPLFAVDVGKAAARRDPGEAAQACLGGSGRRMTPRPLRPACSRQWVAPSTPTCLHAARPIQSRPGLGCPSLRARWPPTVCFGRVGAAPPPNAVRCSVCSDPYHTAVGQNHHIVPRPQHAALLAGISRTRKPPHIGAPPGLKVAGRQCNDVHSYGLLHALGTLALVVAAPLRFQYARP